MSRKTRPWEVWLADLEPVRGHEQGRKRPVVIVSSELFARFPTEMAMVVPLTTSNRGLVHHVPVSGLDRPSWARTDDLRAVSEQRLVRRLATVAEAERPELRFWLRQMIDLGDE